MTHSGVPCIILDKARVRTSRRALHKADTTVVSGDVTAQTASIAETKGRKS